MLRLSAAADKLLSTSLRIRNYELMGNVEGKHKSGFCFFFHPDFQPPNLPTLNLPPLMTPEIKIWLVFDVFFQPSAKLIRDAVCFM
jgi:hypothetical protein